MILTKVSAEKIELRHQRTCDVVFTMPSDLNGKCDIDVKSYIFKMIETLLPKCIEEVNVSEGNLKMMELWGEL